MSNILQVNDDNFEAEVLNATSIVVVDFWAEWCGPCRKLGPLLDDVANNFGEKAKFVKVNVEEGVETAKKYSISGIPCLIIFKNGEAVERMTGLMPKTAIETNIEKHL